MFLFCFFPLGVPDNFKDAVGLSLPRRRPRADGPAAHLPPSLAAGEAAPGGGNSAPSRGFPPRCCHGLACFRAAGTREGNARRSGERRRSRPEPARLPSQLVPPRRPSRPGRGVAGPGSRDNRERGRRRSGRVRSAAGEAAPWGRRPGPSASLIRAAARRSWSHGQSGQGTKGPRAAAAGGAAVRAGSGAGPAVSAPAGPRQRPSGGRRAAHGTAGRGAARGLRGGGRRDRP